MSIIPDHSIAFWLSTAAAITLMGMSKAGFGVGVGVLSTPLMALTMPVTDAAALMLPLLVLTDVFAVLNYRRVFDRRSVVLLLGGSVLGIAAGAAFFGYFVGKDRVLEVGIGVLAVLFVLFQLSRRLILGIAGKRQPRAGEGVLWGTISGFISTLVHAGGPPVAVYLLPQQLSKDVFVGTTVIFFAVTNALKLIPYASLGLIKVGSFSTMLVLSPLCYAGVKLGVYLNNHFSEGWFTRVVYVALFITGVELIAGRSLLLLFAKAW